MSCLELVVFNKDKTVKSFGKFEFEYPSNVAGVRNIINIRTDINCVEYCMIAHFLLEERIHPLYNSMHLLEYQKRRGVYFKFPNTVKSPIALSDFNIIEKATNCSIFIYNLRTEKNNSSKYKVRIIRTGRNSNAPSTRIIYLLQINDQKHVMLIRDIDTYLCNILSIKSARDKVKESICKLCLCKVISSQLNVHEKLCGKSNIHSTTILLCEEESHK